MSELEYSQYLINAQIFLASDFFQEHTPESFAKKISSKIIFDLKFNVDKNF